MQQARQCIDVMYSVYVIHMVAQSQSASTNGQKQCDLLAGVQHATSAARHRRGVQHGLV